MSKNFELIEDNAINMNGRTLYRIRALVDYPNGHAKKGDIGGYVESENNLSDWAWITDDAKVYGNASVGGDVVMRDKSCVYNHAVITDSVVLSGESVVGGKVCISGNAHLHETATVYGEAMFGGDACISNPLDVLCFPSVYGTRRIFTFFRTKDGGVGFSDGVTVMTLQQFEEKVNEIKNVEHPIYKEYLAIISYAKIRFSV